MLPFLNCAEFHSVPIQLSIDELYVGSSINSV